MKKGIWKYSHLLPSVKESCQLSVGEGDTPLIRSRRLGAMLGLDNLYFKLELVNPSGSYKDRFAVCAVADLLQRNIKFCLATSSGNTGAALAAYCAHSGIKCYLAIVDGAPSGKVQQMQVYGAETMMIKDFGKDPGVTGDVFSKLNDIAGKSGTVVQISAYRYSPVGMAGVQTMAYEIAEQLSEEAARWPEQAPHLFSPAGGGGLTLALTKGFRRWKECYPDSKLPRVHCVQPVGNDTIAGPLRAGLLHARAVSQSMTTISGLQVPNVIDGDETIAACRACGGTGYTVTDEAVYESQRDLAIKEGIFCEPAGAVALAGLVAALQRKEVHKKDPVVCLITGHGFKDLAAAGKIAERPAGHYFNSTKETFEHIESQLKKL